MVLRPDRHEHCSVHPQPPFAVTVLRRAANRATSPRLVAAPGELNDDGRPCSPIRRVESRRSLHPLVGESVSEVLGDVSEIGGVQGERFRRDHALEGGGGGRQPVDEGPPQAPREELVAEETPGPEIASSHHAFAQALAALQLAPDDEHHALRRVPFSDHLQERLKLCTKIASFCSYRSQLIPFHPWKKQAVSLSRKCCPV